MTSDKSLNQSMNRASRHYSSLFFLPPFKTALAWVAVLCIGIVGFSTFLLLGSSWLVPSFLLGAALFVVNFFFDYVLSNLVLKRDPVFTIRRTVGLTLFCWVLWLPFIVLGVVFGGSFGLWLWVKFCLLGFCVVLTLRAVVFFSVSSAGQVRAAVASLVQPLGCVTVFMVFWAAIDAAFAVESFLFVVISPFLCLASALLFASLIDRQGRRTHGVPSLALFKAFMLNWVVGLNEPFENLLEKLGEDADIEVSFLKFDGSKTSEPKAAFVVPLVHPGPFKNIGSSLLPSLLKRDFESAFHCQACVPLGILGHELDLASQKQNQKIIDSVISSASLKASIDKASHFVRVSDGSAAVSCQVFGNTAFLSFTLAPKTTEDLPQALGALVREEAETRGLSCGIFINAHNSITESSEMNEDLYALRDLAVKCLDKAVASPKAAFEVGAASVYPTEFTLKDGMGAGGITAVVVKAAEQKTAYIVIDGNNMISGLREKILPAVAAAGFDECEVFTTDTHAVSAVILGKRGYHPVGESMDHETLIKRIREAVLAASGGLESCRAACQRLVVPKVRVIGAERIQSLTTLVDMAFQRAKQIIVPIFAVEALLLVLFVAVL